MARRRLVWKDPGMDALRIGIVWNPSKTSKEELESGLTDAAASAGAEPRVTWWETTPDDAGQGAAASALADGADVIVAAGGDGTVRAVAEHLAHEEADAELGIVPLGTGNLLARNLGRLVTREQVLREVWGPGYEHESHYLRVYAAQLRRKLEDDPAHPRHLVTTSGLGYTLEP